MFSHTQFRKNLRQSPQATDCLYTLDVKYSSHALQRKKKFVEYNSNRIAGLSSVKTLFIFLIYG